MKRTPRLSLALVALLLVFGISAPANATVTDYRTYARVNGRLSGNVGYGAKAFFQLPEGYGYTPTECVDGDAWLIGFVQAVVWATYDSARQTKDDKAYVEIAARKGGMRDIGEYPTGNPYGSSNKCYSNNYYVRVANSASNYDYAYNCQALVAANTPGVQCPAFQAGDNIGSLMAFKVSSTTYRVGRGSVAIMDVNVPNAANPGSNVYAGWETNTDTGNLSYTSKQATTTNLQYYSSSGTWVNQTTGTLEDMDLSSDYDGASAHWDAIRLNTTNMDFKVQDK